MVTFQVGEWVAHGSPWIATIIGNADEHSGTSPSDAQASLDTVVEAEVSLAVVFAIT